MDSVPMILSSNVLHSDISLSSVVRHVTCSLHNMFSCAVNMMQVTHQPLCSPSRSCCRQCTIRLHRKLLDLRNDILLYNPISYMLMASTEWEKYLDPVDLVSTTQLKVNIVYKLFSKCLSRERYKDRN